MRPDLSDVELLNELAPLSLRSAIDPPVLAASAGRSLVAGGAVEALIEHVETSLFASPFAAPVAVAADRRRGVAASVAFQAVVAQTANPSLLAHRVIGTGLEVRFADLRWRIDGWAVRYGLAAVRRVPPEPIVAVVRQFREAFVRPWSAALLGAADVPAQILVGNAAAAIWTAVMAVHQLRPLSDREIHEAADVVLGGLPTGRSGGYVRDTCCLIHHAGLKVCDECPLAAGGVGRCP